MATKQNLINSNHAKLRECSAQLGEERRKLESLKKRKNERLEIRQKIQNLQRAAAEERARLASQGIVVKSQQTLQRIGDADTALGLTIPAEIVRLGGMDRSGGLALSPHDHAYLSSLPSIPHLRARLAAYNANAEALKSVAGNLKSRSSELEEGFRKVVALCTGVPMEKVEGLLAGLVRAVESEEEGVEVARVREFLRRVEETGKE